MSQKKGIISTNKNNQVHVKIIAEEKPPIQGPVSPAPPPSSVTAPQVNVGAKDEIELLRDGVKNIHGHQVKKTTN
ncbi:unnamed protein product [Thelazia callipaeda]|uniref:WH2 domain-containing protein n=1 Tax=Thelazia callipaeda TaxID=103827 RepID=A0A0N5D2H5_THECL|nr:unnamed protein product [Thelazia callipaeda]